MKSVVGLVCVFVLLAYICDTSARIGFRRRRFRFGRNRPQFTVTLNANNAVVEPFMQTVTLTSLGRTRTSLFNLLVQAANQNNAFRFSADYTNAGGFVVTALNGRANDDNNAWTLTRSGSQGLPPRIDQIFPNSGETITFQFTAR